MHRSTPGNPPSDGELCRLAAEVFEALPGTVLWNWLADLPVGRRTGLHRLAEPVVEDERRSDVGLAGGP